MKLIDETKLAAIWDKAKADSMALLQDVPAIPVTPPVVVTPPVTDSDISKLNAVEDTYFTNIVYAAGSNGWDPTKHVPTTNIAQNGQEVGQLKIMKGNWSLPYKGNNVTGMDNKIPVLIDSKFLAFKNVPAIFYEQPTNAIPKAIGTPREMWLVGRDLPGQRWEEKLGGGNNASLLGNNGSVVRFINAQYGITNIPAPDLYKTYIERIVVKDQTQADYWRDGVYMGTMKFQYPDLNNYIKTDQMIGVTSNAAIWDFAAQYWAERLLTDTEAATVFASLKSKWNTGVFPDEILLDGITFSKGKTNYTPDAKVINVPIGVALLPASQWDYQWYQDDGSLGKQVLWSGVYQPSISAFNSAKGSHIKVLIRPKDAAGHVWRFLEGTYN